MLYQMYLRKQKNTIKHAVLFSIILRQFDDFLAKPQLNSYNADAPLNYDVPD